MQNQNAITEAIRSFTGSEIYTLKCGDVTAAVIPYGAALQSLFVPDRDGNLRDIVLGFESEEAYRQQDKFIGATIGRFGNRIGKAVFAIDGTEYSLNVNDGINHLHGGPYGFDKKVWTVTDVTDSEITMTLVSPDGDECYPGELSVTARYRLIRPAKAGGDDAGDPGFSLVIEYDAVTTKPTLCNLTNHSYFNLDGQDKGAVAGSIREQEIQLMADFYTPADEGQVPDGSILPVDGTPMDLKESTPIGPGLDADFDQILYAGGYDRNWMVRGTTGALRPAARAYSPASGIVMDVFTTQAAIQFYSGNFLDDPDAAPATPAGKGGAQYVKQGAFCLETQNVPDAINIYNRDKSRSIVPDPVLRPGVVYHQKTVYHYSVR